MDKIGFVGLGRMGLPMASNIVANGFAVSGFDTQGAQMERFADQGGTLCASIAETSENSDVIITMLPNSEIVDAVIAGVDGILASAKVGSIIMDMSTVKPETSDKMALRCSEKGVSFIDAPVGRLAAHADAGQSLFMVGCDITDFNRVKPLLDAMGSDIYHCGPAGSGTRTKLINNFLAISYCQMNAEALALTAQFGLDLNNTLDVLYGTTAINGQLKIAWPAKSLSNDTTPGFTIDLAHKDLTLVVEAANAAQVPMPMAAAAREALSSARSRGFGSSDFSGMLDAHCELVQIAPPRLPHNSRHKPSS